MISYLNHTTISAGDVAKLLEVEYLGPAETKMRFPLFGILYGPIAEKW
jgi:hypothetical protein